MNFILALCVIVLAPPNEPQIFYYDGNTLTNLNTIMMPNVESETFIFLVNSPYELRSACVDSSEVGLCLPGNDLVKQLKLSGRLLRRQGTSTAKGSTTAGRWYVIKWKTELKVGSKHHSVYLTALSGKIYEKRFTLNVEGNEKQKRPEGTNR
ncbi:MAG: hypothetical protein ACLP05_01560 [Candidatus Kryptoniota bacterium]